jgi:hypothetical protein
MAMWLFDNRTVPDIRTTLPGVKALALLERDERYMSPSYTRVYPLVCARGSGAVMEDVDGNLFLDFTAGIAVTSTGHCHPEVVAAIQDQASKLIHMSGTDFYYQPQIDLAQRLAELGLSWKDVRGHVVVRIQAGSSPWVLAPGAGHSSCPFSARLPGLRGGGRRLQLRGADRGNGPEADRST